MKCLVRKQNLYHIYPVKSVTVTSQRSQNVINVMLEFSKYYYENLIQFKFNKNVKKNRYDKIYVRFYYMF